MSTYSTGSTLPPGYAIAPPAYAGFWIRFLALLLDGVVLGLIGAVLSMFTGGALQSSVTADGGFSFSFNTTSSVPFLFSILYTVGFWIYAGATPGKMVLKLRIVQADTGGPITAGQAIGRYFAAFLSALALCLGFIWVGFDARKQGWHDKLAGTVVIRSA